MRSWANSDPKLSLRSMKRACIGYHANIQLFSTLHGVDFTASGIPSEEAFVAAYCRLTGRGPIDNWNFYVAFALFRLASIAQGVFRRGRDGIGTGHLGGELNTAPQIAAYGLAALTGTKP